MTKGVAAARPDFPSVDLSIRTKTIMAVPKSKGFYVVVSLVISVLLIGVLLSRIQAAELGRTLVHIYLPAYMGISLVAAWLRAWRYKWLLYPRGISWKDMFLVTFIRY
jgi:hypothetical protein